MWPAHSRSQLSASDLFAGGRRSERARRAALHQRAAVTVDYCGETQGEIDHTLRSTPTSFRRSRRCHEALDLRDLSRQHMRAVEQKRRGDSPGILGISSNSWGQKSSRHQPRLNHWAEALVAVAGPPKCPFAAAPKAREQRGTDFTSSRCDHMAAALRHIDCPITAQRDTSSFIIPFRATHARAGPTARPLLTRPISQRTALNTTRRCRAATSHRCWRSRCSAHASSWPASCAREYVLNRQLNQPVQ